MFITWVVGVITLEFAAYHSLVYTLRIAMYWYVVHAVLDLSSGAFGWYRLVQHAANAGAAEDDRPVPGAPSGRRRASS